MSDKKYPYIGKAEDTGCIVVFTNPEYGFCIDGGADKKVNCHVEFAGLWFGEWTEGHFKNITREYLTNTYGKVESEEHAEFIAELAKSCDARFTKRSNRWKKGDFFNFFLDCSRNLYLGFLDAETAASDGEKQITIPMPPKESSPTAIKDIDATITITDATPTVNDCVVDRDFHPNPLNNGDNLMFGGEDKCKEWPKIGDYVALRYRFDSKQIIHKGELLYLSDNHIIIKLESGNDYHCIRGEWDIEKPKTPEEELRGDIFQSSGIRYRDGGAESAREVAEFLLSKYSITKKPQ